MKLKYEFEIVEIGDTFTAVPVGDNANNLNAVINLNESGATMLKFIKDSANANEVLDKLAKEYPDDDINFIKKDLDKFMEKLVEAKILEL